MRLDLETKSFPENTNGGLMICGINWGGNPTVPPEAEKLSFFSDASVKKYPFRNQLVSWFKQWGHPLATARGREGPFERSIFHTNWLPDQTHSTDDRSIRIEAELYDRQFFNHVEMLKPRLIILCGVDLLHALNAPSCLAKAQRLWGDCDAPQYSKKDIYDGSRRLRRFTFGFQTFERCEVVGVPHPSGSKGLTFKYVGAFRDELDPLLQRFRKGLDAQSREAEDASLTVA